MNSRASGRIPRIGILSPATEPGMRDWWKELTQGLNELGYVEGSNVELVWRFADGKFERLPALAAELAGLGVDVIMPATPPAIQAAKSASGSIPIVFPLGSDPVETGLVASLERPGAANAFPARLQTILKERGIDAKVTSAGVIGDTTAGIAPSHRYRCSRQHQYRHPATGH